MDTTLILDKRIDSLESVIAFMGNANQQYIDSMKNHMAFLIDANKNYLEILEKTNNQLSLWLNPYGVLIGFLGILFAVAAIIAGIILYRQSGEYKTSLNDFWKKNQERFESFIKEKDTQLKEQGKKVDNLYKEKIKKLETEIEKIGTGEEEKRLHVDKITELSNKIDDLILERERVKETNIAATIPFSLHSVSGVGAEYFSDRAIGRTMNVPPCISLVCKKCHKSFTGLVGPSINQCPYCGTHNHL